MQVKSELRRQLIEKRKQIVDKSAKDSKIIRRLLSLDVYEKADTVLCYVSLKEEIQTDSVINTALADGKKVAVPYCVNKEGAMDFYVISSLDELTVGTFGVREPDINYNKRLEDFEKSIIIVPGVTFDSQGYRLGFGGGYYDRFLAEYSGTSVGLCYDEMMCHSVPRDAFDIAVNIIITETQSIIVGGENGL